MVFRYCTTGCIYNLIISVWKCVLQAEEIEANPIKYKHLVRRFRQELNCSKIASMKKLLTECMKFVKTNNYNFKNIYFNYNTYIYIN